MKNITIGACDWALPGDGLNAVVIASQVGLEALSLKIGLNHLDYPITHPEMQRIYLDQQQQYGIEYCAIALNDFDNVPMYSKKGTKEYDIVWGMIKRVVPTAKALGVKVIQIPAFDHSEIKTKEQMEGSVKALQYLCDEAAVHGIAVATENLMKAEEFKVLYDAVDRKNYYVYFDSQNYYNFKGYDEVEVLEGLYPYMCNQIHVKDGKGYMSGSLLGKGDSGFYKTMEWLGKHDYSGYILLENYYDRLPLRLENESPYELLKEDIRILKEAIASY